MGEVRHPIEEEEEEKEERKKKEGKEEEGKKEEGKEEEGKEEGETLVCPSLSTQSKLCFPCCTRTGG